MDDKDKYTKYLRFEVSIAHEGNSIKFLSRCGQNKIPKIHWQKVNVKSTQHTKNTKTESKIYTHFSTPRQ
jgi:hypothetical protein